MDDIQTQHIKTRLDRLERSNLAIRHEFQTTVKSLQEALTATTHLASVQQIELRAMANILARSEVDRRAHLSFITGGYNHRAIFDEGRQAFAKTHPSIYSPEQWPTPAWMQDVEPATSEGSHESAG